MAAMIPFVALLTACGSPKPVLVLPPAELGECAAEPTPPNLPQVNWESVETARPIQRERDIQTLDYILALRGAFGSCKAKTDGIRAWREAAGE